MAGTRIVGEQLTGNSSNGTAANVYQAIQATLAANHAQLVSAQYVNELGVALGNVVGASSIPNGASGVVVSASASWHPFFLGVIGVNSWSTGSTATAITPGSSVGGGVLPVGMHDSTYDGLVPCPVDNLNSCVQQHLTSGALNIPGGFGWLKFGCARIRSWPGAAGEYWRLCKQPAVPSVGGWTAPEQLWVLHRGWAARQPRPGRQCSGQQAG